MPRKVCHILKQEYRRKAGPSNPGYFLRDEYYYCGKVEKFIEDPEPETEVDTKRRELFEAEQKVSPWPVCKKCRKTKDKIEVEEACL